MKTRPVILEYYDKLNGICSFWRGRGPLAELSRVDLVKTFEANWKHDWSIIRNFDIALFQRPVHKNCLEQVFICKDLGLKIWIDLDDWKDLPSKHPMYKDYNNNFEDLAFKKILHCADVITVTNDRMIKSYSDEYPNLSTKMSILPNAINDYVYNFKPMSDTKRIVYRGSENHQYDIDQYTDILKEVLIENPDWEFISIGYDIKKLKQLPNYQYVGKFETHLYFGLICNINPEIFIVPLEDNKFNRNKSNISWLEGTFSGAACICPSYFNDTKSIGYNSKEFFKEGLLSLMESKDLRKDLWEDSVTEIKEKYLLSIVNKERMKLIKELL